MKKVLVIGCPGSPEKVPFTVRCKKEPSCHCFIWIG